ncbi:MAG TPA: DinB family protein [Gemmatimonadales bacterium]|nr:DinB family protein [Gemmatimonadales bacterium]
MSRDQWTASESLHHETVRRYLDTARAVAPERWSATPALGKWSPAEITRHLVLAYDALAAEQSSGLIIPIAFPAWKAWALRTVVLPRLLRGRPFPRGVKSPREVRPRGELPGQHESLAEFEGATARFLSAYLAASQRTGAVATHPYFGRLPLSEMFRFASIHTGHHRPQLEWAVTATAGVER